MRTNPDMRLRQIAGEYMMINEGARSVNFNSMYSMSESAAWLWKKCMGVEFTEQDAVAWILAEYDVDESIAKSDVHDILNTWREYGFVVE